MAELNSLIVNGSSRFNTDVFGVDFYANKFIKNGSSDSYVLLGGGGHKALSTFASSFTVTNKDANITTSLTDIAVIAGTTIKAKITVSNSAPTLSTTATTIATIGGTAITAKVDHIKTTITTGTAGTSSATSGSTLAVPYVTMNEYGHVTGYGTHTHTVTGFANSSHQHNMNDIKWPGTHNLVTSATANNQEWSIDLTPGTYTGTYWHVWRATTEGISVSGTLLKVDSDTGKVSAPYGFVGNLTGNASTATTWQTGRTLTIGNTGKSVNGSANVSWSLSEIGAAAASHTHIGDHITGGIIDTHGEGKSVIILGYSNKFAGNSQRGGTLTAYTVAAATTTFTGALTSTGSITFSEAPFNGSIAYNGYAYTGDDWLIVDIKLAETVRYSVKVYWSFGNSSWAPEKMKVLYSTASDGSSYTLSYNGTTKISNAINKVDISPGANITYIRFVFSKYSRLSVLGLYDYAMPGAKTTYMSRWEDDTIGRNLTPIKNNTYNIGSSSYKWANMYATTFHGALDGNAASATKLQTAKTITIGATGYTFDGTTDRTWTIADIFGTFAIGGTSTPIYYNGSKFVAISDTKGSSATDAIQPIYLGGGTLTAASHNAGGTAKPVYVASGVIKPISDTVGTVTKPVYLDAGTITVGTYELKSTVNGGTANRMAYYSGANAISAASSIYASNSQLTINGTSTPANSGNFQVIGISTMRHIYPETNKTYFLGSDSLRWKYLYSHTVNTAITGGTRTTTGGDKGSSANPRYFPDIWTFNSDITPSNGDIITIKTPGPGHDYGVFLSMNNGTNYYPITLSGTGRMTTNFPSNSYLTLLFDSSNNAASMFALAGQNDTTRVTVSGGTWRVINYYDSGNTDVRYQQTIYYTQRQVASDGAIRRYTLCMMNYEGKITSLTLTNNSTATTKTMYTGYLDPRKIYYWAHTDNYSAGANMTRSNTLLTHNGDLIDYRYTFNCGSTLTPRSSFYIVGTIDNNGFKLDPEQPWSCSLPTTDNGKVYIYVGMVYSDSSAYRGTLEENNTIYIYKNGGVQIWSGNADLLDGVHLNGIFTDFSNYHNETTHQLSITVGGITKRATPEFLAPYSNLTYGNSGLQYFNINGTAGTTPNSNVTPASGWYHILRMNHANNGGFFADIAIPLNDVEGTYWRQVRNGTNYGWYKFLDSNNSSVSSGKGYINGTEITQVDNSWYSAVLSAERVSDIHATTIGRRFASSNQSPSNGPVSDWIQGITIAPDENSNYKNIIAFAGAGSNNELYIQCQGGSNTWGSWRKILNSGNTYVTNNLGVINNTYIKGIASLGNKAASDLSSTYPDGLSTHGIYNNEYPFAFGCGITSRGNDGAFQIAGQWNGSVESLTDYDKPTEMYIRGRRDSFDVWTTWTRVVTNRNWEGIIQIPAYSNTHTDGDPTYWDKFGIKEYFGCLPEGLTTTGIYNYGEVISLPGIFTRLDIYCSDISTGDGGTPFHRGIYVRSGWENNKRKWERLLTAGQHLIPDIDGKYDIGYYNDANLSENKRWKCFYGSDIWILTKHNEMRPDKVFVNKYKDPDNPPPIATPIPQYPTGTINPAFCDTGGPDGNQETIGNPYLCTSFTLVNKFSRRVHVAAKSKNSTSTSTTKRRFYVHTIANVLDPIKKQGEIAGKGDDYFEFGAVSTTTNLSPYNSSVGSSSNVEEDPNTLQAMYNSMSQAQDTETSYEYAFGFIKAPGGSDYYANGACRIYIGCGTQIYPGYSSQSDSVTNWSWFGPNGRYYTSGVYNFSDEALKKNIVLASELNEKLDEVYEWSKNSIIKFNFKTDPKEIYGDDEIESPTDIEEEIQPENLEENNQEIEENIENQDPLIPKPGDWNYDYYKAHEDERPHYGVSAQNVYSILPEVTDYDGFHNIRTVNYDELHTIMIASLVKQIEELKQKVAELENGNT